jgi:hydroxymethylpyrimidine pyrophosphatase-like HAD family hydrolase
LEHAVKLTVIALDYDGTIASGDTLDPSVRQAIAEARTRGIVVLLVTGRILGELRRVAGDLHFVDGVIAENGAVVHFPDGGHTSTLAAAIPNGFLEELNRRQIPFRAGQCVVDAAADDAPQLLEVIRSLEFPLVLVFNGGRVMILPQWVSKSTGLRVALDVLRRSARNTLAIGDAENDHELLRLAEVGVAVEWGSAALRSTADITVPGAGPAAVADFARETAASERLPVPPRASPPAARLHRRRPRVLAGGARTKRTRRRGREVRKIVGRGPALRAADSSWLLVAAIRSRYDLDEELRQTADRE